MKLDPRVLNELQTLHNTLERLINRRYSILIKQLGADLFNVFDANFTTLVAAGATTIAAAATIAASLYQHRSARYMKKIEDIMAENKNIKQKFKFQMEKYKEETEEQLDIARKFISTTAGVKYIENDVFILGPRNSGKTSLVRCWVEFWRSYKSVSPTPHFELHEYTFPRSFESEPEILIGVKFPQRVYTKIKIWDFGGEPHLLDQALLEINKLTNCTIVFSINTELEFIRGNEQYYSTSFVNKINNLIIKSEIQRIANIVVLFTKIDLLPASERNRSALEEKYEALIHKIKTVFGEEICIYLVSGATGEGMAEFMRVVSSTYVDESGHSKYNLDGTRREA